MQNGPTWTRGTHQTQGEMTCPQHAFQLSLEWANLT